MNNSKKLPNYRFLTYFIAICSLFLTSACQKEVPVNHQEVNTERVWTGKYSKQLSLTDESGANAITIEISTNQNEYLDHFTSKNFEIIPFTESPLAIDKSSTHQTNSVEDLVGHTQEELVAHDAEFYINVLNKSFAANTQGVELKMLPNSNPAKTASCPSFGIYYTNGTSAIGIRNYKSSCGSSDYIRAIFYSFNQGSPVMFTQGYYWYWSFFSSISCSGTESFCCSSNNANGSATLHQYLKPGLKRTAGVFVNNNNWTVGMSVANYNNCIGNPYGVFIFN